MTFSMSVGRERDTVEPKKEQGQNETPHPCPKLDLNAAHRSTISKEGASDTVNYN